MQGQSSVDGNSGGVWEIKVVRFGCASDFIGLNDLHALKPSEEVGRHVVN